MKLSEAPFFQSCLVACDTASCVPPEKRVTVFGLNLLFVTSLHVVASLV